MMNQSIDNQKKIRTINVRKNKADQIFEFDANDEANATVSFTSEISNYLYEPNAALMKSGTFKSVGSRFGLSKLHTNTHLYTSTNLLVDFPGRIFEVHKIWESGKKELKELASIAPKANISTRNYPLPVEELRKKLKIKEGGEVYLFACTLNNEQKVIVECGKV